MPSKTQWLLLCLLSWVTPLSSAFYSLVQSSPATHSVQQSLQQRSWGGVVLFMGKGDGKKKRKKKSATETTAAAPVEAAPARVTSNSLVPIRHQLAMAKVKKTLASGSSFRQVAKTKTSYTRTLTADDIQFKKDEKIRKEKQQAEWDIIVKNETTLSPLLIVDGYNIIYKWARLTKHMRSGDTARARELLVSDLESLQDIKHWRIEVVFDGKGRSTTGVFGERTTKITAAHRAANKDVTDRGVRVVYTGIGIEADAYIITRCMEARRLTNGTITKSLIIATDDGVIRMAGYSAGAVCMSAGRLVEELKAIKNINKYRMGVVLERVNGRGYRQGESNFEPSFILVDKAAKKAFSYCSSQGYTLIRDDRIPKVGGVYVIDLRTIPVTLCPRGRPITVTPNVTKIK